MTIETLIAAVLPPDGPTDPFNGPWGPIEVELGAELPPDYKDFARLYGCGYFLGYLNIAIPGARYGLPLEQFVPETSRGFAALRDARYSFWPIAGGLLPFGSSENADYLFWLTAGAPETWRIVVWSRGSLVEFEAFDCDLTGFLAGLVTGKIRPDAFPDGLVACDPVFAPNSSSAAQDITP